MLVWVVLIVLLVVAKTAVVAHAHRSDPVTFAQAHLAVVQV